MRFQVQLNTVGDVVRMICKLEQYDYHVDAKVGSYMIDAKSLMGLLGIGLGKKIELLVYADKNERFVKDINEFNVA